MVVAEILGEGGDISNSNRNDLDMMIKISKMMSMMNNSRMTPGKDEAVGAFIVAVEAVGGEGEVEADASRTITLVMKKEEKLQWLAMIQRRQQLCQRVHLLLHHLVVDEGEAEDSTVVEGAGAEEVVVAGQVVTRLLKW